MTKLAPLTHQKFSLKVLAKEPEIFDMSDAGCVSADTEFLTEFGWKRIDQYIKGDKVAQFLPDTREVELVEPLDYIKRPCDSMIAIAPVRGMSQRLSHEHRVLYYNKDGSHNVMPAHDFMEVIHKKSASHFPVKFCSTYSVKNETCLDLTDNQIRIMVAVIADGHFKDEHSSRCVIRLKKQRKITRLTELLVKDSIDFGFRQCGGQPDFRVFTFYPPRNFKTFGSYWWGASQAQLEIIADEVCYWDSSEDPRPSNATRFSTFIKESADFIQYAFAAAKRPAHLCDTIRDRRDEGRGVMQEFTVHAEASDRFIGPGRKDSIYEVPNPEGFKYCFEVPSTYLLLRHNGHIFATGNTGKTPVHIWDFAQRRRKGSGKALVLCPKSLIRSAWGNDFKKFAPDMKVSMAYADNRQEAFDEDADVYVTNIDAADWLAKKPKGFFNEFEILIIDESTSVKHHTSKRSRSVAKLRKYFPIIRCLSGTPTSNGITDLWHQMFIVDGGKLLGQSFYRFRDACCIPEQVGNNANALRWHDKPGIELTVGALIAKKVVRHKFEDCVDIPPNHRFAIEYDLSNKHRKMYDELERDSMLIAKGKTVRAVNGAVLYGKLLQCASGATYADPDSDDPTDYALIDVGRYELINDLIEARKHSVVFFSWRHQRDQLIRLAEKSGFSYALIDGTVTKKGAREKIVEDYQAGEYKVLFAHPQSAGHGLTLTRGTTTIFASPTPNLEHFLQAYKRIYRISQTEKTETIMVIAKDTIDEYVWSQCQTKDIKQVDLLSYLEK